MSANQLILFLHMSEELPEGFVELHERIRKAKENGALTDTLLNECQYDGGECIVCGTLVCPHGEPLHFHHDGCPACLVYNHSFQGP